MENCYSISSSNFSGYLLVKLFFRIVEIVMPKEKDNAVHAMDMEM